MNCFKTNKCFFTIIEMIYIVQNYDSLQLLECSLMKSRLSFIIKGLDINTRLTLSRLILKFFVFLLELFFLHCTRVNEI